MKHNKLKLHLLAGPVIVVAALALSPAVTALHIMPAYRYTVAPVVTGNAYSTGAAVTSDSSGNTFVAGLFRHSVNFAGANGSDIHDSGAYETPYVTKRGIDGSYGWTQTIDLSTGGGIAQVYSLATDSGGNVYAAGYFSGSVVFDGPGGTHSQSISGGGSFINKYSPSGSYVSTQTIIPPPNGQAAVHSIGFDATDNMYLTGSFQDTVDFGTVAGATDNHTATAGTSDAFVTRVNANGSYGWTRTTTSASGYVGVTAATVTTIGNVYLTGYFGDTVNFAGQSGSDSQSDASGNGSVFVMRVNADSSYGWSRSFTVTSNSYAQPNAIATDPGGNVYLSGNFFDTVNFAGPSGSDNHTGDPNSGSGFLTKYAANGGYAGSKFFDASSGGSDNAVAVTTDINGDVYLLHAFTGTVNFASPNGTDNRSASSAGALTMYEPDGSYAWTQTFDPVTSGAVVDSAAGLTADRLGHVYVTSSFSGTVNFAGSGGNDTLTSSNGNAFLSSYTTFIPGASTASATTSGAVNLIASSSSAATDRLRPPATGFGVGRQTLLPALLLILAGTSLQLVNKWCQRYMVRRKI